jgi:hypothetical protein
MFALLNVAMADSYIAGWDSKVHYDFWHPITAIPQADIDGNAATTPDASWTEFLPTPPIQDYPSTHSALGAAAAAVLTDAFGHGVRFSIESTSVRLFLFRSRLSNEIRSQLVRGHTELPAGGSIEPAVHRFGIAATI